MKSLSQQKQARQHHEDSTEQLFNRIKKQYPESVLVDDAVVDVQSQRKIHTLLVQLQGNYEAALLQLQTSLDAKRRQELKNIWEDIKIPLVLAILGGGGALLGASLFDTAESQNWLEDNQSYIGLALFLLGTSFMVGGVGWITKDISDRKQRQERSTRWQELFDEDPNFKTEKKKRVDL